MRTSRFGGFSCCGAQSPGAWASVAVMPRLQLKDSGLVVQGLSCSATCVILLDQGLILLHWRADSFPLSNQGSPSLFFKIFFFFWCGPFLKSLFNLLQYCLYFMWVFFFFFFLPRRGIWDLCSSTRDQTHTSCSRRQSLNHWTAREVPSFPFLF